MQVFLRLLAAVAVICLPLTCLAVVYGECPRGLVRNASTAGASSCWCGSPDYLLCMLPCVMSAELVWGMTTPDDGHDLAYFSAL